MRVRIGIFIFLCSPLSWSGSVQLHDHIVNIEKEIVGLAGSLCEKGDSEVVGYWANSHKYKGSFMAWCSDGVLNPKSRSFFSEMQTWATSYCHGYGMGLNNFSYDFYFKENSWTRGKPALHISCMEKKMGRGVASKADKKHTLRYNRFKSPHSLKFNR
ncbi:MAG: hypothetical protein HOE90_00450 [Bacteriovoracaceae bacterium]|jgi:hypothetical protein|nr:hypothetical protein [Bacteriovoracaceae bacterium]